MRKATNQCNDILTTIVCLLFSGNYCRSNYTVIISTTISWATKREIILMSRVLRPPLHKNISDKAYKLPLAAICNNKGYTSNHFLFFFICR